MYLFLFCSYFVILCYFYCFVCTSVGLLPPGGNPIAVVVVVVVGGGEVIMLTNFKWMLLECWMYLLDGFVEKIN
jgi:hypothetical protein